LLVKKTGMVQNFLKTAGRGPGVKEAQLPLGERNRGGQKKGGVKGLSYQIPECTYSEAFKGFWRGNKKEKQKPGVGFWSLSKIFERKKNKQLYDSICKDHETIGQNQRATRTNDVRRHGPRWDWANNL